MKVSSPNLEKSLNITEVIYHPCFIGAMKKIDEVSALLMVLECSSCDVDISVIETGLSGVRHLSAMAYEDMAAVKKYIEGIVE